MFKLNKDTSKGINGASLGISIVVAVLMGIGIGILLKNYFEKDWLLWVGVVWGIAAAILNIYKMYQQEQKDFAQIAKHKDQYKPLYEDDDND